MPERDILGIGDMQANFAKLRDDMKNRTSRRMVVAGGNVLKRKAKQIAQANGSVRTGAMVKNIAIKREPQAPDGTTQYNLGVRHGRDLSAKQKKSAKLAVASSGRIVKRYQDDPYYWKWVEEGHNIVPRKGSGEGAPSRAKRRAQATGRVPAKPFIGRALAEGRTEALEAMNDRLNDDLAKAGKP